MLIPDVNVLVNAFRSDAEHHVACHSWLQRTVSGPSQFGLASNALSGFLRVVTHPKVFVQPSPLPEAMAYCDFLLELEHSVVLQPGARHWAIFRDLCDQADARGNLIPDAWLAALAVEHGGQWVTLDRDFARFPGLNWSVPA